MPRKTKYDTHIAPKLEEIKPLVMKELLTEDGKQEAIRKGCFFYFKKQKKEILMGVKQTQAQAYLNNFF